MNNIKYFLLFLIVACNAQEELPKIKQPVVGNKGMVSTAHPLATEAGLYLDWAQ